MLCSNGGHYRPYKTQPTEVTMSDLMNEQLELENEMKSTTIEIYKKAISSAKESHKESTTLYGITLMKFSVDAVEEALVKFLSNTFVEGVAGAHARSALLLNNVPPEKCAFLALKIIIDGLTNRYALTKVAMAIGNAIEDEAKFAAFEAKEKGWFTTIRNEVTKRTSNREFRRYALLHTMSKKAVVEFEAWDMAEKMSVGLKMVDLIKTSTGIIDVHTQVFGRKKRTTYIIPTAATLDWIERVNRNGEMLSPFYLPCVVPPKDWTEPTGGGYHFNALRPLPMIKTYNRKYLEEMKNHEMPLEYKAVNALQNTKWTINSKVLEVMTQAWESGEEWKGIPPRKLSELPPTPFSRELKKDEMTEAQLLQLTQWKTTASKVYASNARTMSKRIQFSRALALANRFNGKTFFFPYQSDFRGRKYVVVPFLSPQGAPYAKAMLQFAEGLPIENREQESWLAVHGANSYGFDKASLEERHNWVLDHTPEIISSAADPFMNRFWLTADDPWQFLAFCFEWQGLSNEGYGYLSSLPIGLDGSNNGLQHFSALLRDPVGAKATNLIPSDQPQDIYQVVADKVIERVSALAAKGDVMAQQWLDFGISRKTTKRPVMVVPYGGKLYSCREYIQDYIEERVASGATNPWGDDLFPPSMFLSSHVWAAIEGTVQSARGAMDWIQNIARQVSAKNVPMVWESPSGFVVQQFYPSLTERRITTYIDNTLVKPSFSEFNYSQVDRRRSTNGSSPNFVHSLDAAAMTITICKAVDDGITDFAMIHDSYGVHAHHTPKLAKRLREAFVEMYQQHDPLADLAKSASAVVGDVEPPPAKGELDITGVLRSDFFFS
jgi:DNA-directed RNA polymerase